VPARDDHVNQARHNARFYAALDKSSFRDWAATVLFYTSVHYIDAFLAQKANIHPTVHKTRDNAVALVSELKPIYIDYNVLKNASFNARYNPPSGLTGFTDKYVASLENTHLAKIRNEVARYVSL
jgi:hypothetical protein